MNEDDEIERQRYICAPCLTLSALFGDESTPAIENTALVMDCVPNDVWSSFVLMTLFLNDLRAQ
jgi:hypothetical protein